MSIETKTFIAVYRRADGRILTALELWEESLLDAVKTAAARLDPTHSNYMRTLEDCIRVEVEEQLP